MTPGAGIFRTALPMGFQAAGINCGVRLYRPDLGLIVSDRPCQAQAVFTQSTVSGAHVTYCQSVLPSHEILAVITNSGEANALMGAAGCADNQSMVDAVAQQLGCQSHQVLSASTGVMGVPLSIGKITAAIPALSQRLSQMAENFATAIMTTDLVPKTVCETVSLSQGEVTITGIAKGSGMIHPNMATMLGYLLTDIQIDTAQMGIMLKEAVDKSFNMISVDGETSPNDTVFMLANGASGVSIATSEDVSNFQSALVAVAVALAKGIARDGEGANKLIEIAVSGLADAQLARDIAKCLITSPLIKTAIAGASLNVGRIVARLGHLGLAESLIKEVKIMMQGIVIYQDGQMFSQDVFSALSERLQEDTVKLRLIFPGGGSAVTAWGCDLTQQYIHINAEYLS